MRKFLLSPFCLFAVIEKYYPISPYAYCAGNPISFVDNHGDSLTIVGEKEHIELLVRMYQEGVGSSVKVTANDKGQVSLTPNNKLTSESATEPVTESAPYTKYLNALSRIIQDNKTVTIYVVSESNLVLIGDISTATIDVFDLDKMGTGEYVSGPLAAIHETFEQYMKQTKNYTDWKSHCKASGVETSISGKNINPNRNIEDNQITVNIHNFDINSSLYQTIIIEFEDYNVTKIK